MGWRQEAAEHPNCPDCMGALARGEPPARPHPTTATVAAERAALEERYGRHAFRPDLVHVPTSLPRHGETNVRCVWDGQPWPCAYAAAEDLGERPRRSLEDHAAGLVEGCEGCRRMAIDIAAARAEADDQRRRWWDRLDRIMVRLGRVAIAVGILWLVWLAVNEFLP